MPELIEVEAYREVAEHAVGRRVGVVAAPDAWYLKGGIGAGMLSDLLVGTVLTAARRRGKLLMIDTDRGDVLGLRFGMTGRLVLLGPDGGADPVVDPVGRLLYSSHRDRAVHHRFALGLTDGSRLVMVDPRRLGGVSLDPAEAKLGPDAASLDDAGLEAALRGVTAPLKAALMNQHRLAGIGNLLADEILWRAHLSPVRPASGLTGAERGALSAVIGDTIAELSQRGGSHTGDLQVARVRGGVCPRCGTALRRDEVGGRTTYWCPAEQG